MFVSPLATPAWQDLEQFSADDYEFFQSFPELEQASGISKKLANVQYASDWFHLWLLSGRATACTHSQYEIYVEVLTLASVRFKDLQAARPNLIAMWPEFVDGPLSDQPAGFWPVVPDATTTGMYTLCQSEHTMKHQRAALASAFLSAPEQLRYHCI